jgi:hypothetical protein
MELIKIRKSLIEEITEIMHTEQIQGDFNISRTSIHLYEWLDGYRFSCEGIFKGHSITAEGSSQLELARIIVKRIKEKEISIRFSQKQVE